MTLANIIDKLEGRITVTDSSDNVLFDGFTAFTARNIPEYMENEIGAIEAEGNQLKVWLWSK